MARLGDHFIQGMHLKKGALHRDLGIPEGQIIPRAKIKAAAHGNSKTARRARAALMLESLHH